MAGGEGRRDAGCAEGMRRRDAQKGCAEGCGMRDAKTDAGGGSLERNGNFRAEKLVNPTGPSPTAGRAKSSAEKQRRPCRPVRRRSALLNRVGIDGCCTLVQVGHPISVMMARHRPPPFAAAGRKVLRLASSLRMTNLWQAAPSWQKGYHLYATLGRHVCLSNSAAIHWPHDRRPSPPHRCPSVRAFHHLHG